MLNFLGISIDHRALLRTAKERKVCLRERNKKGERKCQPPAETKLNWRRDAEGSRFDSQLQRLPFSPFLPKIRSPFPFLFPYFFFPFDRTLKLRPLRYSKLGKSLLLESRPFLKQYLPLMCGLLLTLGPPVCEWLEIFISCLQNLPLLFSGNLLL